MAHANELIASFLIVVMVCINRDALSLSFPGAFYTPTDTFFLISKQKFIIL